MTTGEIATDVPRLRDAFHVAKNRQERRGVRLLADKFHRYLLFKTLLAPASTCMVSASTCEQQMQLLKS